MTTTDLCTERLALQPVSPQRFEQLREHMIAGYASDLVQSRGYDYTLARQVAEHSHAASFPTGAPAAPQAVYRIMIRPETGLSELGAHTLSEVGYVWWSTDISQATSFIFDLEIYEPFRRQGLAREALQGLKAHLKHQGIRELGLRVAPDNAGARRLYDSLGFRLTGHNMLLHLSGPG